jgi:hypothetical protein
MNLFELHLTASIHGIPSHECIAGGMPAVIWYDRVFPKMKESVV